MVWGAMATAPTPGMMPRSLAGSLFPQVPLGATERLSLFRSKDCSWRPGAWLRGREPPLAEASSPSTGSPESCPSSCPCQACGSAGRGRFPFSFKAASLWSGRVAGLWCLSYRCGRKWGGGPLSPPSCVTHAGIRGGGEGAGGHTACPLDVALTQHRGRHAAAVTGRGTGTCRPCLPKPPSPRLPVEGWVCCLQERRPQPQGGTRAGVQVPAPRLIPRGLERGASKPSVSLVK